MIKLNREAQLKQDHFLDLQERNDMLKTRIEYARKKNSIFAKTIQQEQERISQLSTFSKSQQQFVFALQQRANQLRLELSQVQHKNGTHAERVNSLKDCRAKLQTELVRCKMTIENQQKQLQMLVQKVHLNDEECQEMEGQAVAFKKKIATVKEKTNQIRVAIANLDRQIGCVMGLLEKGEI